MITIKSTEVDNRQVIPLFTPNPLFPSLIRTMVYAEQHEYMYGQKQVVTTFVIRHYDNGVHQIKLDKPITFYNDGTAYIPKDIMVSEQGVVSGLDSEIVDDFEFYLNWLCSNKGTFNLFRTVSFLYQSRDYNVNDFESNGDEVKGTVEPVASGTGEFSTIDLKYFGLIK